MQKYLIHVINNVNHDVFTDCAISLKYAERRYRKYTKSTDAVTSIYAQSAPDKDGITYNITTIRHIRKGEYFKALDSKGRIINTVYVKDDYDHSANSYTAYRFDDISKSKYFHADARVIIDFTF